MVIGHYQIGEFSDNPIFVALTAQSYLAVDLFMVLSGYVLAMTYEADIASSRTARGFVRFLALRLARLYPLYALTSLVCLVLIWSGMPVWGDPPHGFWAVLANALMVQSWGWPDNSLNSPGWSISTEWAANLLFIPLVALLLRRSWRLALGMVAAAVICLASFAFLLGPTPAEQMVPGQIGWYTFPLSLLRCTTEFMLGMFAWRLRGHAGWTRAFAGAGMQLVLITGMAIGAVIAGLDLLYLPLACLLVIGLSYERSWIAHALGAAVPAGLGAISYSIYLWQMPVLSLHDLMVPHLAAWGAPIPHAWASLACMGALLAVSTASYRLYETPARQWLRQKLLARR